MMPGAAVEGGKRHDIHGFTIGWAASTRLPAITIQRIQRIQRDLELSPVLDRRQLTPADRAPDRLFMEPKHAGSIARGDACGQAWPCHCLSQIAIVLIGCARLSNHRASSFADLPAPDKSDAALALRSGKA